MPPIPENYILSTEKDFLVACDVNILLNMGAKFPFRKRKDYGIVLGCNSQANIKIMLKSLWLKDTKLQFEIHNSGNGVFFGYPYYAFFNDELYSSLESQYLTKGKDCDTFKIIKTGGCGGINLSIKII